MTTQVNPPEKASARCTCRVKGNSQELQNATAIWNARCGFCRANGPQYKKENVSTEKQEILDDEEFVEIDVALLNDCPECGPIWLCRCVDANLSLPFDHKRDQESFDAVEVSEVHEKEELNLIWDPMSDGASETLRQWAKQDLPVVKEDQEVGYTFLYHRQ